MVNSPAMPQSLMNDNFMPYIERFIVIYLDNLRIFSKNRAEHAEHLRLMAEVLRKHGIRLSLKKCKFYQEEMKFLGPQIAGQGYHLLTQASGFPASRNNSRPGSSLKP